jgi:hypothetical protein
VLLSPADRAAYIVPAVAAGIVAAAGVEGL